MFGGRMIASDLVNPDFVALARSFGIAAERVHKPADLEAAVRSALAGRSPALIEVEVGPMSDVWPVMGPAGRRVPHLSRTRLTGARWRFSRVPPAAPLCTTQQ